MTSFFVANPTKQNFKFHYRPLDVKEDLREDEGGKPITLRKLGNGAMRVQDIRPGGQIRVAGDLSHEEIAHIVAQYHPYGMKPVDEIHGRGFTGLIYSIGKPVEMDGILFSFEQNDTVMDEEARKQRQLSAAAIADDMTQKMAEFGVDVARVETITAEDDGTGPKSAEVFEVVNQSSPRSRGGRRAA